VEARTGTGGARGAGRDYDVIVIGAGPAGEVAAARLAEQGRRVALVERHLVGGECAFYACMPSKALLRPAELLHEVARVPGLAGGLTGAPGIAGGLTGALDVAAVLARRDQVIHGLNDEHQLPWIRSRGIDLVRGQAQLDGERRVRVDGELLGARDAIVIAVGSGAAMPPIPGIEAVGAWSNRELATASEVPERMIVLGGGVVGVEMAQAWASLGSRVAVIEALPRLLAGEEPFAGEELRTALEEAGVSVITGARAAGASRDGGPIKVSLEDGRAITGDRLLVATGRRPLTERLGLETVGLKAGELLQVDDHMRVLGAPGLYAVGDVNGRSLLTHSGKYQARIAVDHILGRPARAWADAAGAPRVVFTDPQIAAVGVTLDAALAAGADAIAIDLATADTPGASFHGRGARGTTRFVVDRSRDLLLGATFVGPDVAEMLQAATIAVVAEVPLSRLAHAIAPFPTRSELWLKFVEAYERRCKRSLHGGPRHHR
jgi:pyruvate/2-oxoglutarate dehydrogenase complex dihydrolipoamide dehydrogenase (E3) component